MIFRQKFEDKLTKELLKIVHYNLQASIRLSLFSKDVKVVQSFNSSRSLLHELAVLNINERCPYDCFLFLDLWNSLRWILKTSFQCS